MAESCGFTGLGALSLPGFPILPLPGQCVVLQLGCRRLPTTSRPQCIVARGAAAAGPVLLVCHPSDPHGMARTLPSRGAVALRCAPLLPRRMRCRVDWCAVLAAGQGGGTGAGSRLPFFPLAPLGARVAGCPVPVSLLLACWYAIPVVCVFRDLGPVALLVRAACPFCVCAPALPRYSRSPSSPVSCTHFARSPRRTLVGPFQVVRAPPRFLLGSLSPPVLCVGGGLARTPCLPAWLNVACPHGGGFVLPGQPFRRCGASAGGGAGRLSVRLVQGGARGPAAVRCLRGCGGSCCCPGVAGAIGGAGQGAM